MIRHSLKINISDRSCVTNATYPTGAQSKISVKIHPSPHYAPVGLVAFVTQERSLMLISSCAVSCWMGTSCIGKLKAPVVKQKSFKLEREVGRFFQADRKRGPMGYPSLRWRENRAVDSNFGEKTASRSRSFEIETLSTTTGATTTAYRKHVFCSGHAQKLNN